MKIKLVATLALLLGLGAVAYADGKGANFIRYKSDDAANSGLQVAVTDYVSSNSQATVTLYGVVHVADSDYYKDVQTDLDKFDAVLYEGVKTDTKPNSETKVLNAIQTLMGDVLGLQFQKEGINYTRKNLIHADISIEKLQESLKGESITPFGQYIKDDQFEWLKPILGFGTKLLKEYMKQDVGLQNTLKEHLATQLGEADVMSQLSPEMYKAIVLDRNQIVMDVLQEQFKKNPEKKTFCIFYGAAHMPDMESRLQKMGFKESSKRWKTAWKVTKVETPEDDENK